MEFEKSEANPNPFTRANPVSKLFFWWLTPFFIKGRKGDMKLSDIYDCPKVDSSEMIGDAIQREWDKELKKLKSGRKPSLAKATVRAFWKAFCFNAFLIIIQECFMQVLQSVLLGYLIQHFARTNLLSKPYLYLITAVFCLMTGMFILVLHPCFFFGFRTGMRLRVACCTLIYRKALKLSQASLGKTTVGQMVNLLSNDVNRFDLPPIFIPYLIVGPLQTVMVVYVLWTHIGYASVAGVSALMLFAPFQLFMGKAFSKLRLKTAALTDERIRLMNEIIGGMRVIKMYGWEMPFAKLADLSRRKEVKRIRQVFYLRGFNVSVYFISCKVLLLFAFVAFVLGIKGDLTPEKVFVCMSLFSNIDRTMSFNFPSGISYGAEGLMSLKRIQNFLLLEEQTENSQLDVISARPALNKCGIWMNKVKASWNKDGEATLRNVTLTVKPGELLAVVGPVGCGKSSLLMTILGELPITSGEAKVRGRVAYASQEPWVFGGTIRQNILFGSEFDEYRYRKILSICALDKDIEQFPHGDQTAVGERGVSLSGGQKARVNLARAIYLDADIFLMDDPLSAVDSSVSKHLFEKCIKSFLKDKVRILATHQIQFLKKASQILVLKDGECLALGSYDELISVGVDLGSLMEDYEEERRQRLASTSSTVSVIETLPESTTPIPVYEKSISVCSSVNDDEEDALSEGSTNVPKAAEEIKSSGSVGLKVYKEYLESGTTSFLKIAVIILNIVAQAVYNGSDFWLTSWTSKEQLKYSIKQCWTGVNKTFLNETGFCCGIFDRNHFKETVANVSDHCFVVTQNYTEDADKIVDTKFWLSIFAGLVLVSFLLTFVRTASIFEMCMRASVVLHDKMFRNVLRSPVAFFDNNPIGRILNRFSKDVGIIDEQLPLALHDTVTIFCRLLGIILVVAIVEPYLLIPALIINVLFVFLRRVYLPTVRDVKRYEGITRSPVFSHLSTSLYGLTTIRAFKVQQSFEDSFDHHQDQHTATWFLFLCVARWFAIALDMMTVTYVTLVTVTMVILSEDPSYASKAGLAIASTLQLCGQFQWCVRQSTEVESQMTSVERIIEYSTLKSEGCLESEQARKPPKNWPSKGHITYRNVSLKYDGNESPVLKNLSFEIHPKEKIGIVGRTGAGKSSMIATLFRMTEPEGEIEIDGICTKDIGLHDLRKKISIIPQDPVLFTGPVRRNLDPFREHNDSDLWEALDEVCLKEAVDEMSGGLDTEVSEGGSNFSVGQRQLVCLARAILRRNRILVLDEATANVDPNTDSLIQKTIRDRFAECTVLTIAHRLHTIMDSDRVLVLDAGKVKEFDEPYNLLQKPNGLFSHMVQMTGAVMAKQLRGVAYAAHLKNFERKHGDVNVSEELDSKDFIEMNGSKPILKDALDITDGQINEAFEHAETHL